MDTTYILSTLAQLVALGGWLTWLTRRNAEKIDRLAVDLAVIASDIRTVREDHDKLILLESFAAKHEKDITSAHEKIRNLM